MSGFLLDTCAISEIVKKVPDSGLSEWMQTTDPTVTYLSTVTLGELRSGIEQQKDETRKARLETWLVSDITKEFSNRILSFDAESADRWGRIVAHTRSRGDTLPTTDTMIAAIALNANLSVVTRNEKHFTRAGVPTINPWKKA